MRFCSFFAGRRSPQNWDHPLVDHVGNLPSASFLPLLTLEKCVGLQKLCMCPPGIHFFMLLTLCLTLQTSDFIVCFGRDYDHQQKMNCKEWRAFQSCLKILVTRKLRKWVTKAELFKTEVVSVWVQQPEGQWSTWSPDLSPVCVSSRHVSSSRQ